MAATEDANALKCRYASKRCWNPRAIKRNGERHNLCEVHRQKANSNQRRLDKKRKAGQLALGLHGPMQTGLLPDQERRLRIRSSIAMKLEKELGAGSFTSPYIRPPPAGLMDAAGRAGAFASRSREVDAAHVLNGVASSGRWGESSPWREPALWEHEWPKSPRAMLRAAAALKREAAMPELRRAATFGGYQHHHQQQQQHRQLPQVERSPQRLPSGYLPPLATAVARTSQGLLASARSTTWQPERIASAPQLTTRMDL